MRNEDNRRSRRREYLSGTISGDDKEKLELIQLQRGRSLARGLALLCFFIGGFWLLLGLMTKGQLSIPPNHHALVIEHTIFGDRAPRILPPGNHVVRKKSSVVVAPTGNVAVWGAVSRKPGLGARALKAVLPGKDKAEGVEVKFSAGVLLTTNQLAHGIGTTAIKEAIEKGLTTCAVSPLTEPAMYPEAAKKSVVEALAERSLTLLSIEFQDGVKSEAVAANTVAVQVAEAPRPVIGLASLAAFKTPVSFTLISVTVLLLSTVALPWFWVAVAGLFLVSSLPDEMKRRAERMSDGGSCCGSIWLDGCAQLCSCSLDLVDLCSFGIMSHTANSGECHCGAHDCDCGDCGPCDCGACDCGGCDVPGCDC